MRMEGVCHTHVCCTTLHIFWHLLDMTLVCMPYHVMWYGDYIEPNDLCHSTQDVIHLIMSRLYVREIRFPLPNVVVGNQTRCIVDVCVPRWWKAYESS